jgi:formylglycine-generating enzyme required for sulfatase activity
MKNQSNPGKGSIRHLLLRRFLWISVIAILAIMSVPFFTSMYDKFIQDQMNPGSNSMQSDEIILPELMLIPAGSFEMGEQDAAFIENLDAEEEKYFGIPGKHIQMDRPFYMSKYEITNEQYDSFIRAQKFRKPAEKDSNIRPIDRESAAGKLPAVEINWQGAMAYAIWLGEQKQLSCRLPTEAEWEYAARAGLKTAYPWGNEAGSNNANCSQCGSQWDGHQAAPVGQFKANPYGLYDTSGNVWEWTCSAWHDQFDGQEQQCARMDEFGSRVLRGGSWAYDSKYMRSSVRGEFDAGIRYNNFGFRVLCVSPAQ